VEVISSSWYRFSNLILPFRLPDLLAEVDNKVQRLKDELSKLPTKLTGDPAMTVINMVANFKKDVELLVKGRPEAGKAGLIQNIRRSKERFRDAIFHQAPEFKPFEKPAKPSDMFLGEPIPGLPAGISGEVVEEDLEPRGRKSPSTIVYMDEVLERAQESASLPLTRISSLLTTSLQRHYPGASQPLPLCR
jgi:hypothetical protein